MKSLTLLACGLLILNSVALAEGGFTPHRVMGPDGKPDMGKCAACHTETFELARPKAEVCTFCHGSTPHCGAAEHLRARPERVAQLLPKQSEDGPRLLLTEDGHMFCGTCHLFHDPALSGEKPLATFWVPGGKGLAGTVRKALAAEAPAIGAKYGASGSGVEFSKRGTTALRLRVDDGSLCRHCHGGLIQ